MPRLLFTLILLLFGTVVVRGQKQINRMLGNTYTINSQIARLRSSSQNCTTSMGRVLYPFGPECADEELSKDLSRSSRIKLNFVLPVLGHHMNELWINQHGFVSFQESFYGVSISQDDWPHPKYPYVDDPIFIAPLYAQTDLIGDKTDDLTDTKYGRVLFKVISRIDLPQLYTEEEKFVYEMSLRILNDGQALIREANVECEEFIARHVIIVTWKSLSFSGNSLRDLDLKPRNTFQLALFTDEIKTVAVLNYEQVEWYASTSLGGNPETGTGGKAAKIGFNRGNGTQWYNVKPYSENAQLIQNIENASNVNLPGRLVYRLDERIRPGGCMSNERTDTPFIIEAFPEYSNMLGGQEVNITGPCFDPNEIHFYCKWGDSFDAPITIGERLIQGEVHSLIHARCIQPLIWFNGRLNLSISLDGINYPWKVEFTLVDPLRFPAKVELVNINDWHQKGSPPRLLIRWTKDELSYSESDTVDIELWGYYEDSHGPHWDFLQRIGTQVLNKGSFGFDVAPNRATNQTKARLYKVGAIRVSMYDTLLDANRFPTQSKYLWSALHPIGWWRNDEMKFYYDKKSYLLGNSRGKDWAEDQCRWWHEYRKNDRFWMDELEICPPTLMFAIGDMGVWAPDPQCNMYGGKYNELNCLKHPDATHCVITVTSTTEGAGNRCCYDFDGNLLYTNDTHSGSTPDRYHSLGQAPFNEYGKVPGLSHYFHDIVPYYLCCKWSNLCDSYLYLRETKDAKGYKEPRPAVAYGDPHLITFDGKDYTFNGKGEFVLFKSKLNNFQLQARFEQPPNATFCLLSSKGQINATRITSIVAGQDDSDIVEVRSRIYPSASHILNCDVLINGKIYYFDRTEQRFQFFKNVFITSPLSDDGLSNVTLMFNSSGVGVQVGCLYGLLHVRVSAPHTMFKETSGLFGYWDNITANDFTSPDGSSSQLTMKPDLLYQRFGMAWRIKDESESLFTYSGSWNFDTFHDQKPIIREWQRFRPWFTHTEVPFPSNVTFSREEMMRVCDGDEQCMYDAASMGSLEIGESTKHAHRYYRLMHESMKAVNSCGIYLMKGGIRRTSTGNYLTGSVMKVSCKRGYMLFGWPEFKCHWNGTWLPTNGQWIAKFRDWPYCEPIRWSAILISSLWVLFILGALIRYCLFKKQKEKDFNYNTNELVENVPFDEKQMNAEELEQLNLQTDGFDTMRNPLNVRRKLPSFSSNRDDTSADIKRSLSMELLESSLSRMDSLEKPAILIQIPRQYKDEMSIDVPFSVYSNQIKHKRTNNIPTQISSDF